MKRVPARPPADLFAAAMPGREALGPGATILRGFASDLEQPLLEAVAGVTTAAPFRHLVIPGGFTMSVAMTNCGEVGWVSDRKGYRYEMFGAVGIPAAGSRFEELVDAVGIADRVELLIPEGEMAALHYRPPDGGWRTLRSALQLPTRSARARRCCCQATGSC